MQNTLSKPLGAIAALFHTFQEGRSSLDRFKEKERKIEQLIARHQKSLERARKQYADEAVKVLALNPVCAAAYLQPLAEAILVEFPGMQSRLSGPFGLGATTSITIFDPRESDPARSELEGVVGWLQFRFDHEAQTLSYVDTSVSTKRYPPGSLGELNGLNFPTVPLTAEMSLSELAGLFRRGYTS